MDKSRINDKLVWTTTNPLVKKKQIQWIRNSYNYQFTIPVTILSYD